MVDSKRCPIEPRCVLNVLFPNCGFDCLKEKKVEQP